MTEQKLKKLLRHAYQWGRDNGSNRSEKNFNDFLQTEAVKQALSIAHVQGQSEQFYCTSWEDGEWKCKTQCVACATDEMLDGYKLTLERLSQTLQDGDDYSEDEL